MAMRLRHTAITCAVACGLVVDLLAQQPQLSLPPGATASGASQQILLPPPNSPAITAAEQQNDPAQLKVYEVPSELIGAVGARLQITYHGHPRVRVATEPKTGQLMVMAPESIQRDINSKMQMLIFEARKSGMVTDDKGMTVGSTKQHSYPLKNLRPHDLEAALQRLAGPRLTNTTERNGEVSVFRLASATGMQDVMQIDRTNGIITMLGNGASVAGWMQIIYALDMGQSDPYRSTHVMPLAPADPQRVRQAVKLVRATYQQQDDNQQVTAQVPAGQGQPRQPQPGEPANPDDPAMAIGSTDTLGADTGLFGDVQIEFIEDLDLVIIKGAKRDVQRTLEVIEQIKQKSKETQPAIEVLQLKHVDSQAVATLIDELYDEVLKPRQGAVSITSLGQPNALLLIGRAEAVQSIVELINKLDQPLDPSNQLRVFRLLHASAVDAESTIRDFFSGTVAGGGTGGGAGGTAGSRTGLGTRVKLIADYRTNSLIIQAAPRDLSEVAKLIEQIDVEGTTARNEVRIFRLKNSQATAVRTVLNGVITGEGGGGTGQGQGQGQGGGGGGNSSASSPSTSVTIATRNGRVDSGILAGVVITADESQNSLVVRGPAKSMALIEELIRELDQLPDAEAQIKVFPIKNGSASTLAQMVQQLFGLPVTAGQGNATGGLFGGLNNQLALAGLTAGGDGSLVQLRVSVDTRTNSIIVSGSASDLEVIEVLLLRLDEAGVEPRTNEVFWLRNANAQDVANALSGFLNTQRQFIQQQLFLSNAISIIEQVDREIFIVAEPTTNSLIVSATPRYFESIRKVIAKLDRRPPLVAVQALIAEVTLSDTFEFGTEFGLQDSLLFDRGSSTGGTLASPVFNTGTVQTNSTVSRTQRQNVGGQGLSNFATGRTNTALGYGGLVLSAASESVGILVRALQDANRLQILSRPQIMTMDNRPASVQVGATIARVQGVTVSTFGNTPIVTDTPVGLILQIWPRVNEDGLIVMQVYAERSSLGAEANGTPVGFGTNGEVIRTPPINKTSAQTTISAYTGQTVLFAGLIQKQRTDVSRRVPWLGDIPYIGRLFRFDSQSETRSELLIILTPRIIQTDEDYEVIKQVESSRMSYCLADILEMHGDVGLSGGHGFWGPARGPVIYPDMQPSAVECLTPENTIMEGPYNQPIGGQPFGGQPINGGPMIDNGVPNVSPVPPQPPAGNEGMIQAAPNMQPVGFQRPPVQASYQPAPGPNNQVVPTSATMPASTVPTSTMPASTVPTYKSATPMRSMGSK